MTFSQSASDPSPADRSSNRLPLPNTIISKAAEYATKLDAHVNGRRNPTAGHSPSAPNTPLAPNNLNDPPGDNGFVTLPPPPSPGQQGHLSPGHAKFSHGIPIIGPGGLGMHRTSTAGYVPTDRPAKPEDFPYAPRVKATKHLEPKKDDLYPPPWPETSWQRKDRMRHEQLLGIPCYPPAGAPIPTTYPPKVAGVYYFDPKLLERGGNTAWKGELVKGAAEALMSRMFGDDGSGGDAGGGGGDGGGGGGAAS